MSPTAAGADAPAERNDRRNGWVSWFAGAVLVVLCLVSWKGFRYPHYAGAVIFQCAVLVLMLAWAFPNSTTRPPGRRANAGVLFLAAYAFFSVCSSLHASDKRLAAVGSVVIVFPVVWALALGHVLRSRHHFRLLLRAVAAAGTVAALSAASRVVYRLATRPEAVDVALESVQEVLGHRNFLAVFLLPPLVLCVADLAAGVLVKGVARGGPLQLPRWLTAACSVLMLACLALCTSVGSVLALAAGAGVLLGVRLSRRARWRALAAVVALGAAGVVVLSLPQVVARLAPYEKFQRWFLWEGTVRMFLERPFLGWGSGMFLPKFALFKPHDPMRYGWLRQYTVYPHNEVLLVAVEGGMLALIAYLGGLFSGVGSCLGAAERETDPQWRLTLWAVTAGFAAMFVQGLVTVSLRFWAPAALYWTLIGLMLAARNLGADNEPLIRCPPVRRRAGVEAARFLCVLAAAGLALVYVVWSGTHSEWLLGGAYRNVTRKTPDGQSQQVLERVEWTFPRCFRSRPAKRGEYARDMMRAAALSRYVPDVLAALSRKAHMYRKRQRIPEAVEAYEAVEAVAPGYGTVRRTIAALCLEQGKKMPDARGQRPWLQKSIEWYDLALEQNPYDYRSRVETAAVLIQASMRNLPKVTEHLMVVAEAPPGRRNDTFRKRALALLAFARQRIGPANDGRLRELEVLEERLREGLTRGK